MVVIKQNSTQVHAPSDAVSLAQAAGNGDREAQRELLSLVLPRVKKSASFLCSESDERDDLVQNALLGILDAASRFRGECSLNFFADRITCYTFARQYQKKKRRLGIAERFFMVKRTVVLPDLTVERQTTRTKLLAALSGLSPEQRTCVVLHYLHDYQVAEIAGITGAKVNTVRGRLRNGLAKLRGTLLADPFVASWLEENIS